MNNQRMFAVILIVITVVLAIASFILLPSVVTTQLTVGNGNAQTMPRIVAILVPTLLGLGGSLTALFNKNTSADSQYKPLVISGVGIIVFVIMLIVNL